MKKTIIALSLTTLFSAGVMANSMHVNASTANNIGTETLTRYTSGDMTPDRNGPTVSRPTPESSAPDRNGPTVDRPQPDSSVPDRDGQSLTVQHQTQPLIVKSQQILISGIHQKRTHQTAVNLQIRHTVSHLHRKESLLQICSNK